MSKSTSVSKLTQEKLKESLNYDIETGIFTWKVLKPGVSLGEAAGGLSGYGYIKIMVNGTRHMAHRLAWLYVEGYFPENNIDHINRIRNDNRFCNLREVSHRCNMRNREVSKNNKIGVTGVTWNKRAKKYQSNIKIPGEQIYLGLFENILDAATARWEAEKKHGFPNCNTTSSAYEYIQKNSSCDF